MFEIGNTLREARVRRKLTLQQVEEDTKIRVKYLQAMENEDFDIMPGTTYVKGFLRTYATYLGLDPEVIIDEYCSRDVGHVEQQDSFGGTSVIGAPRGHRRRNTVLFVAVFSLLVLGVIYVLSRNDGANQPPPLDAAGATGNHDQPFGQREALADALSDCSFGRARRAAYQRRGRRVGGGPQGQRHGRRALLGNDEERQDQGLRRRRAVAPAGESTQRAPAR